MIRLFEPKTRDKAIQATISYLIMAGSISPAEVPHFIAELTNYDDVQLAKTLLTSWELNNEHLANQGRN